MNLREQYEMAGTIGDLLKGKLDANGTSQFLKLLESDAEACQFYSHLIRLDTTLDWLYGAAPSRNASFLETTIAAPSTHQSSSAFHTETRPVKVLTTLGKGFGHVSSLVSRPLLYCIALVALCLYGTFALVAWNLRPDQLPSAAHGNDVTVAMISSAADVHWSHQASRKADNSAIRSGEALKIESGIIELELSAGTKLVVEGPADWSIEGQNSVSLRAGKLIARVPTQAIGFTVVTPKAEIVDLGTEFAVEVDKDQNAELHVFTGIVVARKPQLSTTHDKGVQITAGNALRVDGQQAKFTPIPFNPKWRSEVVKGPPRRRSVALQNPTGTFSQSGYPVSDTIDGQQKTGWAMLGGIGSDQQAVWETTTDVGGPDGTSFIFTLVHAINIQHGIGKFRLSVTTDDRRTFADGLPSGGKVTAHWTELKPLAVFSNGGETFTINEDNTVLVSGTNPTSAIYSVAAKIPLSGITGIRLEVFADASFAGGGPGRYPASGNFGLSEFRVQATPLTAPKTAGDKQNPSNP
jgi:hypothetical protein